MHNKIKINIKYYDNTKFKNQDVFTTSLSLRHLAEKCLKDILSSDFTILSG